MIIPVILAGGSGTRLWPLSREFYPKQLISLCSGRTMLQNTLLRLSPEFSNPLVICNQEHRFLTAEQLRAIDVQPSAIILEPAGRNTAPAIAVAAIKALSIQPDALLLVLPADHHVSNPAALQEAILTGIDFANSDHLVTFGIVPSGAETGYGYIRKGEPFGNSSVFRIDAFIEKPDLEKAGVYTQSGEYLWNSGMFLFKASLILEELRRFMPEIPEACSCALNEGCSDLDFYRLDKESFCRCPSDSIDYAVMEKTDRGAVVSLDCGWSDLGSWDAFRSILQSDENGNTFEGDVLSHDVRNSYIHASSRLVAAIGIEDQIVVETPDAVLVVPCSRAQDVKVLVDELRRGGRGETFNHKKVYRPWGSYENINIESRFQVKRITVKPGAKLSLQKHYHRAEHWVVVRGTALITRGNEQVLLKEDESTYIPLGMNHRLENPGKIPLELIEVQSGSYLGEDDILRYDDEYGRNDMDE